MSKPLLMKQNYVDGDLLVSQTYSSQLIAAPSTNIQFGSRRSKLWRTQGYWNITSSNNTIKFKDSGGTLTATIAVAEYLTDATFLAAVDVALEAAGGNDYTVTRDTSTNKIKLTSNGAAFQLLLSNVGFTAKNILGFTTGSDLTGALTYTADTLKIHTSEWIRWDLGVASLPQAVAIIGARNEGIQLSSDAVVTLMGSSTDAWTSPEYIQVLDWHEDCIFLGDSDGLHTSGLRYWRIEIVDASNPDGYLELSKIYLGETYSPTQGSINFPFDSNFVDYSRAEPSQTGVNFVDVNQQSQEYDCKWYGLTKTEQEELNDFVVAVGLVYPFFICLDPDAVFSSEAQRWVRYVRFDQMPRFELESPNLFSTRWSLKDEL